MTKQAELELAVDKIELVLAKLNTYRGKYLFLQGIYNDLKERYEEINKLIENE